MSALGTKGRASRKQRPLAKAVLDFGKDPQSLHSDTDRDNGSHMVLGY